MAVLGLRRCAQAFSSCGKRGCSLLCAGSLIAVASLVVEHHSRHMDLRPTGLTAPRHVESSWSWDWAHVPHMGRQIPNQWTSREALLQAFFPLNLFMFN